MSDRRCINHKVRQFFCNFAFFMIVYITGYETGLTLQQIPDLVGSQEEWQLTHNQITWISSMAILTAIPANTLGGVLADQVGRRLSGMIVCPLYSLGFLLTYLASPIRSNLIIAGKVINGVASGLQHSVCFSYFTEITEPKYRTAVHSLSGVWLSVGLVTPIVFAALDLTWKSTSLFGAILPMLVVVMIYFCPESPVWLLYKERDTEALEAMAKLRGSNYKIQEELYFQTTDKSSSGKQLKLRDLPSRLLENDVWKPFLLVNMTYLLQIWTGGGVIDRYIVLIFQASGSSLGGYSCSIMVHSMKIIGRVLSSYLLVRFNRRPVFIASSFFTALGLLGLGASILLNPGSSDNLFTSNKMGASPPSPTLASPMAQPTIDFPVDSFALTDNVPLAMESTTSRASWMTSFPNNLSDVITGMESKSIDVVTEVDLVANSSMLLDIMPLISGCIVTIMFSIGLGPIPWAYGNILFPHDLRSQLCGVSTSIFTLLTFIQVKTYPELSNILTVGGTCLLFGAFGIVCMLWGMLFLPETRGKSAKDISEMFLSGSKDRDAADCEKQAKPEAKAAEA